MTIIERALEKHRPAAETGLSSGKRGNSPKEPIDPAARLPRTQAVIDRVACRERRVLMLNDSNDDKRYVAAYRMLRTRLLHRTRTKKWTTIAVTSAGPNDGKTTTTINLALSLAREKSRETVLLDMDMRNPSVCRTLGVEPAHELRDYLEHRNGHHDLFFSLGSENLLVAGSITPTELASELLSGTSYDELLELVKRGTRDPIILIDLPPVLVTDDALVVAPKVDAMLIVASEGLTSRSELTKALNLLSEFTIAGVVLNQATDTTAEYSYGYTYEGASDSRASRTNV
ncbi:MAG: CpsD/CapB family tyrosine-protein kinase [Pseudomonadota bacterium]|nr:CpsD/CapB family tyrosine-protein kinase [Pseudomonadota bacterium]